MANIVYIATSLDGFIAKKNGDLDWLMETPNADNDDFGFSEFQKRIDAILMGRKTFEQVLKFGEWPYKKPVFVLSRTLKSIPEELSGKVEIIHGNPTDVVDQLNSQNYHNLYIDGGVTVQGFLEQELIDELIITRIPILLGDGIPLFSNLDKEQRFEHIATEIFNGTLVKSSYKKR